MFSLEEINEFKVEAEKLFSHSFDKESVSVILNQLHFEIGLKFNGGTDMFTIKLFVPSSCNVATKK